MTTPKRRTRKSKRPLRGEVVSPCPTILASTAATGTVQESPPSKRLQRMTPSSIRATATSNDYSSRKMEVTPCPAGSPSSSSSYAAALPSFHDDASNDNENGAPLSPNMEILVPPEANEDTTSPESNSTEEFYVDLDDNDKKDLSFSEEDETHCHDTLSPDGFHEGSGPSGYHSSNAESKCIVC
jgi:hypothetical protein